MTGYPEKPKSTSASPEVLATQMTRPDASSAVGPKPGLQIYAPHLTLANAPRAVAALTRVAQADPAALADPLDAITEYGDDLAAVVEVFMGPDAVDLPLPVVLGHLAEHLPAYLQRFSRFLDEELTPAIERLTPVVQALITPQQPAAPATTAPAASSGASSPAAH